MVIIQITVGALKITHPFYNHKIVFYDCKKKWLLKSTEDKLAILAKIVNDQMDMAFFYQI